MKIVRTWGIVLLGSSLLLGGCFTKKKINPQLTQGAPVNDSVAPDKVLYQRSLDDIAKGRYEISRLTLQSLINTYPDSEYLAKAKLAIADSYYKEGGNTGLSQSILEYKDFITFFPFLDECAYAQMQIGMAHYRRVEKPDRDRTEAEASEEEFQIFLTKYASSPLVPQVEQQLRNVQEILADGDFRVAQFYFTKADYRASAGRLLEVASRYPLYSKADKDLWMLAGIYDRSEKTQFAGLFYSRIVSQYPLSPFASDAKARLTKLGLPVPQADPNAIARMTKEQNTPHPRQSLLAKTMGPIESRPNMSMAAKTGAPQMAPPEDDASLETLVGSNGFNLNASGAGANSSTGGAASGGAAQGSGNPPAADGSTNGTGAAVEIVTPGSTPTPGPAATTPTGAAPPPSTPAAGAAAPANGAANPGAAAASPASQTTQPPNCTPQVSTTTGAANSASNSGTTASTTSGTQPNGTQQPGANSTAPPPCQQINNTKKKRKKFPW